MRWLHASLLVLPLLACRHTSAREPAAIRSDALDEVERGTTPAIVIATIHGDEIAIESAGRADLRNTREVGPDTAFAVFSITKLFTATAVLQLHERGLLDIDAPVREYLGDELAIDEPAGRPITARDLLRHGSGLGNPSVWALARPWPEPRPPCRELLAQLFAAHGRKLRYMPGRGQRYSNLGYLVLGRLVEVVDGRSYEDYVAQEILDVLGMTRSGFDWGPLLDDAATGHSRKGELFTRLAKRKANPAVFGEPLPEWETTLPFHIEGSAYGGLITSANDLAKFVAAQLGEGSYAGRRILSPASTELMRAVQRDDRGKRLDFALGWHTGQLDGERYYNHMGKGGGYRPEIRLWPGRDYGVVILTNLTKFDPRPLSQQVPP